MTIALNNIAHTAQMTSMRLGAFTGYRTIVRTMLFLPAIVVFGWALVGDLGSLAAGSTELMTFGIVGVISVLSMMTALALMIASRVTHE